MVQDTHRLRDLISPWLRCAAEDPGERFHERKRRAIRREQKRRAAQRERQKRLYRDNLRMNRLLDPFIGQRWDEVYSRLCETFSCKRYRRFILEHCVDRFVSTRVILDEEGYPRAGADWMGYHGGCNDYYVCPITGALKKLSWGRGSKRREANRRVIDRRRHHCKIDGQWYLVEFAPIPPREDWADTRDVFLNMSLAKIDRCYCVPATLRNTHGLEGSYAARRQLLDPNALYRLDYTDDIPGWRGRGDDPHIEHRRGRRATL